MALRWTEKQYQEFLEKSGKKYVSARPTSPVLIGGYASKWAGRVQIGDTFNYYRSLWEYNYACYLEFMVRRNQFKRWEHEPERYCFKDKYKRPPYDYLPDFRVTTLSGYFEFHEVKGWMNGKSRAKIKRFERHFPQFGKVIVRDKDWFKCNESVLKCSPGYMDLKTAQNLMDWQNKK